MGGQQGGSGTPRGKKVGETQQEIVDGPTRVFALPGIEFTPMADSPEDAGISMDADATTSHGIVGVIYAILQAAQDLSMLLWWKEQFRTAAEDEASGIPTGST